MKKTAFYLIAFLFAVICVLSLILAGRNPAWIIFTIISVPGFFVSLVLGWCAGKKEGDIPFVGY